MEYVYIVIAILVVINKFTYAERSTWDYFMIALGFLIIGTSVYRLFFKKN
jgi:hypothetical protein